MTRAWPICFCAWLVVGFISAQARSEEPEAVPSPTPESSTPRNEPYVVLEQVDRATVRVLTIEGIEAHLVRGNRLKQWFAFPILGHGSGVAVSGEGLILTAAHVVHDAQAVFVKIPGNEGTFPAVVVFRDDERDFALLSVHAPTPSWLPLPGDVSRLRARQPVSALGYPMDAERPLPQSSQGIMAGVMPNGMLQLSIAVNPGNSGGPLIDEHNQLLGIVVARGDPSIVQGVALAVPINLVRNAYRDHVQRHREHPRSANLHASALLVEAASAFREFVDLRPDGPTLGSDAWQKMAAMRARRLDERLLQARRGGEPIDALVAAHFAAFQWNLSVLEREREGPDWYRVRYSSAQWAHWATRVNPRLLVGSRFLRVARRRAVVDFGLSP